MICCYIFFDRIFNRDGRRPLTSEQQAALTTVLNSAYIRPQLLRLLVLVSITTQSQVIEIGGFTENKEF